MPHRLAPVRERPQPHPTYPGCLTQRGGIAPRAETEASPAPPRPLAPPQARARSPAHPAGRAAGAAAQRPAVGFGPEPPVTGAAHGRHARAPGPVTASGMDGGSVSREGPKRPPDRRRLLLFLLAGRCGSPGGVPARRCLSALAEGLEALGPRAPAARVASSASALFLLVPVPVPRLAAAAPRRPLGDRERSCLGPSAPPAGRCCAWRCQPGLVPGVACAAGPLHLCHGRVPALASARRGRVRRSEERGLAPWSWDSGAGRGCGFDLPGGRPGDPEVGSLEVTRLLGRGDEGPSGPALLVLGIRDLAS